MRYNESMGGHDQENERQDISRGAEVPSLMDKIDGKRTAAEIAFELGVTLNEILDRLDALAQARIISIFDGERGSQRLSRVSVVLEQAARNTMALSLDSMERPSLADGIAGAWQRSDL